MPADPVPVTTPADPLHAYSGAERRLRDAIERIIFREAVAAQGGHHSRGTIYAANEIMALMMGGADGKR